MNDLLSMNSPLDRLKAFGGKSVPLRDKSRATLAYYCSRSDLKSSSSLSSFNPGRTSLGNPIFSSDNMSKDSDSKGAIHPMRTNTVRPKEVPTKKQNSWCRDQPLERKTISQPIIPDNPASQLDANSRSLHFINFKNIDDDDDYDEVEIPTQSRLEARHVMLDNYSTPNDESVSLLPQQAQDKTEEDGKTIAEVLSSSSDQLQSQSSVTRAKSKWNKIRTTVKMAGAFSPSYRKKGVLEREDSFLKRFSTRQGGTKEAPTEDFSGTRSSTSQYGDQTLQIKVLNSQ